MEETINRPDTSTVSATAGTMQAPAIVSGFVAPGFESVREEFARGFAERGEIGAAVAVYRGATPLVDLWGGLRSPSQNALWERQTMALVYSTTKGLAALAAAHAHSRGLLDYDARVSMYWPEFAQNGKADITVRQLLAHQAGLCSVDEPITSELMGDLDRFSGVLARQRPAWVPGTRQGYHPLTVGFYVNEIIRRVDWKHRSIGQYFQDEIARPLDAEIHLGLPDTVPDERLAELCSRLKGDRLRTMRAMRTIPPKFLLFTMLPGTLTRKAFTNMRIKRMEELGAREYLRVEMPSANAVATARGLAKVYGEFASGGKHLGLKPETLRMLEGPAHPASVTGSRDATLHMETSYSLGFWKPFAGYPFGSDERAYGTPGGGGSVGFADPKTGIGFGYVPNLLGLHILDDPRATALRHVVYKCLVN